MNDYQRIAKAIAFIQANQTSQPSLEAIAAHVHLSPFHFQRLFSQWAGVSPKKFLQVLTLENAKQQLRHAAQSQLNISENLGLSSTSRLYDHFIQLEAVSPEQYKQYGQGLEIAYGWYNCPFGECFIAQTPQGICQLLLSDGKQQAEQLAQLAILWPDATLYEDKARAASLVTQIFAQGANAEKPLSLQVRGTNFQIQVWRALLNIAPAELRSYSQLAQSIGKPKASRAVGTAIGANPIAFLIPCHRVIQQSGQLGGYRWGLERKQAMLSREAASCEELHVDLSK